MCVPDGYVCQVPMRVSEFHSSFHSLLHDGEAPKQNTWELGTLLKKSEGSYDINYQSCSNNTMKNIV